MDNDCVFCKIAAGGLPSYSVYEDDEFKIILDRFPWIEGHTLILIKRHAETLFDLSAGEYARLSQLTLATANAIKKSLMPDGLNVMQNNGDAAGQSVAHFHTHIIPRYKNDGVHMLFPHNDPPPEDFKRILSSISLNFTV